VLPGQLGDDHDLQLRSRVLLARRRLRRKGPCQSLTSLIRTRSNRELERAGSTIKSGSH
jgi:hypothetical protein